MCSLSLCTALRYLVGFCLLVNSKIVSEDCSISTMVIDSKHLICIMKQVKFSYFCKWHSYLQNFRKKKKFLALEPNLHF
ncbi:hypothetical protein X975_15323, partial [Stegodyphus mimosarum]